MIPTVGASTLNEPGRFFIMAGSKKKRKRREASINATKKSVAEVLEEFQALKEAPSIKSQMENMRAAIEDAIGSYIRKRSMLLTAQQHLSAAETLSRVLVNLGKLDWEKLDKATEIVENSIRIAGFEPEMLVMQALESESEEDGVKN